jgi:acyl-CoA thioesterase II
VTDAATDGGRWSGQYAADLLSMLDIEELDRDLYRGRNSIGAKTRSSLFGGQVAAQSLRAAGLTVAGDRHPHSLHGYFLRPGRVDRPVILRVDRDRDGRSFSARRVIALQNAEVIFSMVASFHVDEEGETFEVPPVRPAPSRDELPDWSHDPHLQVRASTQDQLWVRPVDRLPDDRLVHACALTYISDLGHGFGGLGFPVQGSSIDHAVWFNGAARADRWVLLDLWPLKAGSARGLYLGAMRYDDGTLAAMLTQEILMRRPRQSTTTT